MNSPAETDLTGQLHEVNGNLRHLLHSLAPGVRSAPATPLQMNAVLDELLRAGEWLRAGSPRDPRPELDSEIAEYRQHLEQLRDLLPFIHSQLLQERARLEAERARLDSAAEWAQTSRQSL
jgi:hypothetical protein